MNLSGELVICKARFNQFLHNIKFDFSHFKEIEEILNEIDSNHELFVKELKTLLNKQKIENKVLTRYDQIKIKLENLRKAHHNLQLINFIHVLDENTNALTKISSSIQSEVMQTRMIPIEATFTRFKRILRDISKELQKEVTLEISGEETELDKKIVDAIAEPLTHMIRNAIDHGIEDPTTRRRLGKDPVGKITLKAYHDGNNICIQVSDDGRGLDTNKILNFALARGIITKENAEKFNTKNIYDLIFLPGFSTADKVSNISGRGVGMDVVQNMIRSINGVVDIQSEINKGTSFNLMIPITLAIIQALEVEVAGEIFAIPLESVVEIIRATPKDIFYVEGNETVKLREHALTLAYLQKLIKINKKDISTANNGVSQSKIIVTITSGDIQLGLIVDKLIGKDEIVIKALSEHYSSYADY
ncbi:MAG: chemotaxis protein CheA [Oligoflexia bacterium]|nr:chemotaxis protein CheA [Oligoflexia bacterium]